MARLFVLLISMVLFSSQALAADTIRVFNWTEYMPPSVLRQFTAETGIEVAYETYESNEVMLRTLTRAGQAGYDVVFPSSYYVSLMRKRNLLAALDPARLSNLHHLDPALLDKDYDPENRFSLPYLWGGTGIGVNTDLADPAAISSWADLWNPLYRGKVLLLDDLREVFAVALLRLGYSINDTNPDHIREAFDLLQELRPLVHSFNSEEPRAPFMKGYVAIGMLWNGPAYMAQAAGAPVELIWPKEGAIMWMDCMAIPKTAPNPKGAHAFINFLLRPDIGKAIAEYVGFNTPNLTTVSLLSEAFRTNPALMPPMEILLKSEFQNDVGGAIKEYELFWNKLKTGK